MKTDAAPRIVVIGGSAGAIGDLTEIVQRLPADLPASLLTVVHIPAGATSMLPSILNRFGRIEAKHPSNGEEIEPSRLYVAPPDHHLLVDDGRIQLAKTPRENGHRPAIDPLFRSAAASHGNRVVGVVLSGMRDDGTAGLAEIKARGGAAIAVDPEATPFWMMPKSAIDQVDVDEVVAPVDVAGAIVEHCCSSEGTSARSGNGRKRRPLVPAEEVNGMRGRRDPEGEVTGLTCPECSGPLFDETKRGVQAYRCRTGHRYSLGSLLMERGESVERALWVAIEALREKAIIARNLSAMARRLKNPLSAERYEYQAGTADRYATMIEEYFQSPESDDADARSEEVGVRS